MVRLKYVGNQNQGTLFIGENLCQRDENVIYSIIKKYERIKKNLSKL